MKNSRVFFVFSFAGVTNKNISIVFVMNAALVVCLLGNYRFFPSGQDCFAVGFKGISVAMDTDSFYMGSSHYIYLKRGS